MMIDPRVVAMMNQMPMGPGGTGPGAGNMDPLQRVMGPSPMLRRTRLSEQQRQQDVADNGVYGQQIAPGLLAADYDMLVRENPEMARYLIEQAQGSRLPEVPVA